MAYVGGLRARLISDNLYNLLKDSLEDLGWMDAGRQHAPVRVEPEPLEADEEAKPNVVTLSEEFMSEVDSEMGHHPGRAQKTEKSWDYVIDIYGENQAIAKQLAADIYDVISGKFTSLGRTEPILVVYDLSQATPSEIFTCQIEDFSMDKARNYVKSYQRFWWSVFFTVVDEYTDEDD